MTAQRPEDDVRRYLDAGVEARLNVGGVLGVIAFFGVTLVLVLLLGANRHLRGAAPLVLPAALAVYGLTFGRLLGSANREGVRRRWGALQPWTALSAMSSSLQAVQSRDQQGRKHVERFVVTTWTFGGSSLTWSDRFLSNGSELRTFAAIAAQHAQPGKFDAELSSEDARAALDAFAKRPPARQQPQRPMLAGARPWIVAALALAFAVHQGVRARAYSREAEETSYGSTPESEAELDADLRASASRFGLNSALSGLLAVGAIGGAIHGRRALRRRAQEAGR